jgi:hypothetical protein
MNGLLVNMVVVSSLVHDGVVIVETNIGGRGGMGWWGVTPTILRKVS